MTRLPSLRHPTIGFAHRGARAHERENTLDAFHLALRLGATGLESDVWLTSDGIPVLDHDGLVGSALRRRRIATLPRSALPDHVPSLEELYADCGTGFELSLDIKDPDAAPATFEVARAAGAAERLWACHHDWRLVASWRSTNPDIRLADSTHLRSMRSGPERRAAELAGAGIDAVNLHHSEWTGGLTTLFHRFGVLAFGWDAQLERVIAGLLDIGLDGIYSDHTDRMMEAITGAG